MENMVKPADLLAFKGKRVFITGHTGFKGSWLLHWLLKLGAEVKGYSLAPVTSPSLFSRLFNQKEINSVIGDINHYEKLSAEIVSFRPDFIFHLAAQPLVRESYKTPVKTFLTNVTGTSHVLDSMRKLPNACSAVFITTDKVYENKEWHYPYRENDRLGGYDPYSASKACSEIVISSYRNSFFNISRFEDHHIAIASARAGNVIGGGDWSADRLVPDIVRSLVAEDPVVIRNPSAVRPWQHVMEPLFGYMTLALHLNRQDGYKNYSGSWNFGPMSDDNYPVKDLAINAVDTWGKGKIDLNIDPDAPHEAKLLKLDISKAMNELGWKPRMNAQMAVSRTINWYKSFYSGGDARELVNSDIAFYQSLFI